MSNRTYFNTYIHSFIIHHTFSVMEFSVQGIFQYFFIENKMDGMGHVFNKCILPDSHSRLALAVSHQMDWNLRKLRPGEAELEYWLL